MPFHTLLISSLILGFSFLSLEGSRLQALRSHPDVKMSQALAAYDLSVSEQEHLQNITLAQSYLAKRVRRASHSPSFLKKISHLKKAYKEVRATDYYAGGEVQSAYDQVSDGDLDIDLKALNQNPLVIQSLGTAGLQIDLSLIHI